jgi:hypothetical protein
VGKSPPFRVYSMFVGSLGLQERSALLHATGADRQKQIRIVLPDKISCDIIEGWKASGELRSAKRSL